MSTITETQTSQPSSDSVLNIAAYKFAKLTELPTLRSRLKSFCDKRQLKGTILLSAEGINLFIAGNTQSIAELVDEIRSIPGLEGLETKESWTPDQPFHRMLVKVKKEIIAFGIDEVQPAVRTSPKLPAKELRDWLSEGRPVTLLDTRNDYEIQLGTFRNAIDLNLKHFRDFPKEASKLPEEIKNQPVVMFCTGGIRCEKAGPYMESLGFREIYQLEGGILKYFEECGGEHYDGSCFVFDQRVAVGPDLIPTGDAQCFACQATLRPADTESPHYVIGVSCPYCYEDQQSQRERNLASRQRKIDEAAQDLPGCKPYANVRTMHVPRALSGMKALDFLDRFHPGIGRDRWQQAIESQTIFSPMGPITVDYLVREGERLEHHEGTVIEPAVATDIRLLFEDEELVVVDKPAPLPSHASGRFFKNTLDNFLSIAYRPEKLRMAHRLDANTTGLMLFSRRYRVAKILQKQFEDRTVDKVYLARVHGHPTKTEFSSESPIAKSPNKNGSRSVDAEGQSARTDFEVLKRFEDGTSLLAVRPTTGRTNQIRIHLWQFGFPIVGDPLYRPDQSIGEQSTIGIDDQPMCLHAWKLAIDHPISNQRMQFETAQLPTWADGR